MTCVGLGLLAPAAGCKCVALGGDAPGKSLASADAETRFPLAAGSA